LQFPDRAQRPTGIIRPGALFRFASSYYRDTDGVIGDLVAMLTRMGIEPAANKEQTARPHRYTEAAMQVADRLAASVDSMRSGG